MAESAIRRSPLATIDGPSPRARAIVKGDVCHRHEAETAYKSPALTSSPTNASAGPCQEVERPRVLHDAAGAQTMSDRPGAAPHRRHGSRRAPSCAGAECGEIISACRRARSIASIAPNGSSMSRMSGSAASARARPTRCCFRPRARGIPRRDSAAGEITSASISSTRARVRAASPAEQRRHDRGVLGDRHVREQADLLDDVADARRSATASTVATSPPLTTRGRTSLEEAIDGLSSVSCRCPKVRGARRTARARPQTDVIDDARARPGRYSLTTCSKAMPCRVSGVSEGRGRSATARKSRRRRRALPVAVDAPIQTAHRRVGEERRQRVERARDLGKRRERVGADDRRDLVGREEMLSSSSTTRWSASICPSVPKATTTSTSPPAGHYT